MPYVNRRRSPFRQRFAITHVRDRIQRGGAALIVTVLMAGGAMMGMAALVVDVGHLYIEREELQSGADAAVVRLAAECATGNAACLAMAQETLDDAAYAKGNAKDGAARVIEVCGTVDAMTPCGPQPTGLSGCIGTVPPGTTYVQVRTATETADGDTLLPPIFGRAILDNGAYNGKEVQACARASIGGGPPASGSGMALTISYCEYEYLPHDEPPPPAEPSADGVFYTHKPQGTVPGCPSSGGNGMDAPGGFGWLDQDGSGTCMATVSEGDIVTADPGNNTPGGCQAMLDDSRDNGTVLFMPIYSAVYGQGNNTYYVVDGFAGFVATGYFLGTSTKATSTVTGEYPCGRDAGGSNSDRCISGYFTTGVMPGGSGSGPDYGVTSGAVAIIG